MQRRTGFTIIELLVIIVVISILAGITIVGYGSWQRRVAGKTAQSDLLQVKTAMKNSLNFQSTYPSSASQLASSFSPSAGIELVVKTGGPLSHFSGLSAVQNGVLFYTVCNDLVADGYSVGTNNGGASEQYVSGCNVYNKNEIQVNSAWTPRAFNTSVQSSALPNLISSINYNDSWRPNRAQIEKTYYQTWNDRFIAQGGSYPITSFWDSWANSGNSGVPKQDLPGPDNTAPGTYCVQASSSTYSDVVFHVTNTQDPQTGPC